jgi:hypothetical protein
LIDIFSQATGFPPMVWGTKRIGFGRYRYKYPSGHQGKFYMTGFSVGKATAGKSCIYINKLDDVDLDTLKEVIVKTVQFATNTSEYCV